MWPSVCLFFSISYTDGHLLLKVTCLTLHPKHETWNYFFFLNIWHLPVSLATKTETLDFIVTHWVLCKGLIATSCIVLLVCAHVHVCVCACVSNSFNLPQRRLPDVELAAEVKAGQKVVRELELLLVLEVSSWAQALLHSSDDRDVWEDRVGQQTQLAGGGLGQQRPVVPLAQTLRSCFSLWDKHMRRFWTTRRSVCSARHDWVFSKACCRTRWEDLIPTASDSEQKYPPMLVVICKVVFEQPFSDEQRVPFQQFVFVSQLV